MISLNWMVKKEKSYEKLTNYIQKFIGMAIKILKSNYFISFDTVLYKSKLLMASIHKLYYI